MTRHHAKEPTLSEQRPAGAPRPAIDSVPGGDQAQPALDAHTAAAAEAAAAEAAEAEVADGASPAAATAANSGGSPGTGQAGSAAPSPAPSGPPAGGPSGPPAGGPPPPAGPPGGPGGGSPPPRPPRPPGLREQAQRTFEAGRGLITAHIVLAKAELAVIAADLKQVVAQAGLAVALLLYIALLVPVGTALFLGEWLFGSMGWGILHGALFSVAAAVALVLGALRISRTYLVGTLLLAVVIGIAVGAVFGLALPNALYAALGETVIPDVDPAWRPLVLSLTFWSALLAVLGIFVGARAGGVGGAIGGFFGGAIVGLFVGAFTAISFSLQVGVAIGVSVTLIAWPLLAALSLRDYDWEDLKRRFTPQASMDAAEETKAFIEARLPGRGSTGEDGA